MMYWKAKSMRPPLQPMSWAWSQETSCCSERETSLPEAMAFTPSTAPVLEKDQQEPHWPWFFTSVTAPFSRQSTAPSATESAYLKPSEARLGESLTPRRPVIALNSSVERSENWLRPSQWVSCSAL